MSRHRDLLRTRVVLFIAFCNSIVRIHSYSDRSACLTTNAGEKDSLSFANRQPIDGLLRITYFDGETTCGCLTTICNPDTQAKRIALQQTTGILIFQFHLGDHQIRKGRATTRAIDVRSDPEGTVTGCHASRQHGQDESDALASQRAEVHIDIIELAFVPLQEWPPERTDRAA